MLKALIDSKLYLAFAAFFLCLQSQVQLGMRPQMRPYLSIVFFSTLLVYNLPKLTVLLRRSPLFHRKSLGFFLLVLSSLGGLLISLCLAQQEILALVLMLGGVTFWYSIPLLKTRQKFIKLRSLPYAKIFVISFVWSAATVLIPFAHPSCTNEFSEVLCLFAERFSFIFAITIPFDIRDIPLDQKSGLKTLPMLFDARNAQRLAWGALLFFFLLTSCHNIALHRYFLLPAFTFSFCSTLCLLCMKNLRTSPLYYDALLDGSMLLQSLLVLFFYYGQLW